MCERASEGLLFDTDWEHLWSSNTNTELQGQTSTCCHQLQFVNCQSSFQKSCTGISTVDDCSSPSLLLRRLICRFSLFLSRFSLSLCTFPPVSPLFPLFHSLSFVLLLQGHDDAAPCAVLKSVDSFSFLQHPVHQRSLEILQRCKEEKYSKAAYTTLTTTTHHRETVGGEADQQQ